MIRLIYLNNPMNVTQPMVNEIVEEVTVRGLLKYIPDEYLHEDDFLLPTVCHVSQDANEGDYWMRENGDWEDRILPEGSVVTLVSYPRGLSLLVVSLLVSVAVVAVAYFLLPRPQLSGSQTLPEVSPTYSLDRAQNSFRIDQAEPVQYGNIRTFPDLAARPYTEFRSNNQFFFMLLNISAGEVAVDTIQIDDTNIDNFDEVEYNVLPPGTPPSIFPTTVNTSIEVSDIALSSTFSGPFTISPADFTTSQIAVDFELRRGLYTANNEGGLSNRTIHMTIQYRPVTTPESAWVDVLVDPDPLTDEINVTDLPSFLSEQSSSEENRVGNIRNRWRGATNQPLRHTFIIDIPDTADQIEVRVKREEDQSEESTVSDEIRWVGARAYSATGHPDYGDRTMLEIRIRATDQLSNQNFGAVNVIGTRKIRTWTPDDGFSAPIESRSIMWAIADAVTNSDYGGGLPEEVLPLAAMYEIDQVLTTKGSEFNGRFETTSSLMEALQQIATVGRCLVYQQSGNIKIARDQAESIPTAMFTPYNIKEGSLSISWTGRSAFAPNYTEITYFDRESWSEEIVDCVLPGETPDRANKLKLFGVTDRQSAWEEGMYITAQDRYRRRQVKFTTDVEGYIPTMLDLIVVPLEAVNAAQVSEVQDIQADVVYLSEPVDFGDVENGFIRLKDAEGNITAALAVSKGPNPYSVRLTAGLPVGLSLTTVLSATMKEASVCEFRHAGLKTSLCRVRSIRPLSQDEIEITCVKEDGRVHSADVGTAPAKGIGFVETEAKVLSSVAASAVVTNEVDLRVTWRGGGYAAYLVEWTLDGVNFESVRVVDTSYSTIYPASLGSPSAVRVVPIDLAAGGVETTLRSVAVDAVLTVVTPALQITNFAIEDAEAESFNFTWDSSAVAVSFDLEMYASADTGLTNRLFNRVLPGAAASSLVTPTDLQAVGVTTIRSFIARARLSTASANGAWSQITVDNAAPAQVTGVSASATQVGSTTVYTINVSWTALASPPVDFASYEIHIVNPADTGFVPDAGSLRHTITNSGTTSTSFEVDLGSSGLPATLKVVAVDVWGRTGSNPSAAVNLS